MKKICLLSVFIFSNLFSEFNVSYMLKYADGENSDTDIFENYVDVNMYYDNLYIYSFLKYADPPLIGYPTDNFDDFLNIFFVEYNNDNLDITIGDVLTVYGRGLSLHTYQDRDIDYNNGIRGISMTYSVNDRWDIYSLFGINDFKNRSNPANDPDINIGNKLFSFGATLYQDLCDLNYSFHINNQKIDSTSILVLSNFGNYLGDYLFNTLHISENPRTDYSMKNFEHNIGANFYFDNLDLYSEYSKVYYNKIHGERTEGYRAYLSAYTNLLGVDILYEYKNYNTPYLYSVFSNPPTVFKETSSPLISRHLHVVDFNNEVGHQFIVNKTFENDMNLAVNYAFSYKHNFSEDVTNPSIDDVFENMLLFKELDGFSDFLPYRQLNIELNGWNKKGDLFYKIALDIYNEHINITNSNSNFMMGTKLLEGITMPTQFSHMFDSGNSLSYYLELQTLKNQAIDEESNSIYFNPSFNYQGKWISSLFYDYEMVEGIKENWLGVDFTYYITDTNVISIFAGSQKGGLVCANGTCIQQPDFDDGFKLTLRTMF